MEVRKRRRRDGEREASSPHLSRWRTHHRTQATKWVSDSVVKCVVPGGAGVNLPVHITVCGCGDASRSPQSTLNSLVSPVVFSYDEDVMKVREPASVACFPLYLSPSVSSACDSLPSPRLDLPLHR